MECEHLAQRRWGQVTVIVKINCVLEQPYSTQITGSTYTHHTYIDSLDLMGTVMSVYGAA